MRTTTYTTLNENFNKMILNLEKIERETLDDLKKLESIEDIIDLEGAEILPFFHKGSDGVTVDVRGISPNHKKMDDNHLLNTIRFYKRRGVRFGFKVYIEEATKRGIL